jgi:superoxide dismutase
MAMNVGSGFVGVWLRGGRPQLFSVTDYALGLQGKPILALDLCEHAYFGDYAFCKERYIKEALRYINTDVFNSIL